MRLPLLVVFAQSYCMASAANVRLLPLFFGHSLQEPAFRRMGASQKKTVWNCTRAYNNNTQGLLFAARYQESRQLALIFGMLPAILRRWPLMCLQQFQSKHETGTMRAASRIQSRRFEKRPTAGAAGNPAIERGSCGEKLQMVTP